MRRPADNYSPCWDTTLLFTILLFNNFSPLNFFVIRIHNESEAK